MPIAFQLDLAGRVDGSGDVWPTVSGAMTRPGEPAAILAGTVSVAAVEAFEADVTWHGFSVKLGGAWIPEDDLLGDLQISGGMDDHARTFSFSLAGEPWSILSTEQTWTRTPVEIWIHHGSSPASMKSVLEIAGYVITADQEDDQGPALTVRCGDHAMLYDRLQVCAEVPPFAGRRRGELVADILAGAGITSYDLPSGAIYAKPLQAAGTGLFEYLRGFIEPEGWTLRFLPDGTLSFRDHQLKEAPQAPDAVWAPDDWEQLRLSPPSDVPSRWILRSSAAVVVDEAGLETRISETAVIAPYRPKVAEQRQLSTGEIVFAGNVTSLLRDRVVSRVVDEQVTQAGRLVRRDVREYGWYNPRAAQLRTAAGAPLQHQNVRIDEDGEFVSWRVERFVLLQHTITVPSYDEEQNLIRNVDTIRSYHRRTMGISSLGSSTITVNGAYIYGDDQSYHGSVESFGKSEEQITTYEFDPASGAQIREIQDAYRHYAPRCLVDGPSINVSWYKLYNGEGQVDLVANWRRVESRITTNRLADDGAILGKAVSTHGYDPPDLKHDGANDWGGKRSDQREERFRFQRLESERFDIISEDQYQITRQKPGESPTRETVAGKLPLPTFRQSAWTRFGQQPIEVVLDDETLEAWFGFERAIVQHEHVQDIEEARKLLERRRQRALARQVEVVRPRTLAREGDTVLLVDPRHGLHHRGLIVREDARWDLRTGSAISTYLVEIDL